MEKNKNNCIYSIIKGVKGRILDLRRLSKHIFILFFVISFIPYSYPQAQELHSVSVRVNLPPPYTPFLSEYGSIGTNRLQLFVKFSSSSGIRLAKVQMILERINSGIVMQTGEYASIPPRMFTGGVEEMLTGMDLSALFMAQNNVFSGFDQLQYAQTGRIPDGQYRIGFRVVDAQRSEVILSNTAYTQPGWFILNDPPLLNLPRNKAEERIEEPQSVKLEWFPRHLGSLNSAFATSYQIELFALRVPGMDPNQAALSRPPDFTDITTQTRYYIGPDKFVLEPGVEYAWRVKAFAEDLTLFQNGGYSEVFSFGYGSLCPVPADVEAEVLGTEKALISWETDPLQTAYIMHFRANDTEDAPWHEKESYVNSVEISDLLSAGRRYDYQVKAKCGMVESAYSDLASFTTDVPMASNFQCGLLDTGTITNQNPKPSLKIGDYIYNGEFPIKLTSVEGSDGVFKGTGRMRIPFLANIQVNMEFENIKVNELNEVYEGELVSVYNPDSRFFIEDASDYFGAGDQVGNVITGREAAAITLGYPVSNASQLTVSIFGNTVTVTGPGGVVTQEIETSTGGTTIADSEGNLYTVSTDGIVTEIGKSENTEGSEGNMSSYLDMVTQYNQLDDEIRVEFRNSEGDLWAFDAWQDIFSGKPAVENEYEEIDGERVPWKLIPAGKSGKLTAEIVEGSIDDPGKVVFKTPAGTEYYATHSSNKYTITIAGAEHGDAQEIYALYKEDDNTIRSLGKVKAASYNILIADMVVVPVGEQEISESEIKEGLKEIFLPYGIEWNVKIDEPFIDMSWDDGDGKLEAGNSQFFSEYTSEMSALNAAYAAQRPVDEKTVYIFVFAEEANETDEEGLLLGDMPISSQFGYVFNPDGTTLTAKTLAHELGHGKFQLKHTWDESYGLEKQETDNIMDYSEGIRLYKYQWDAINDPQILLFTFLQGDEEGELVDEDTKLDISFKKLNDDFEPGKVNLTIEYEIPNLEDLAKEHKEALKAILWITKDNMIVYAMGLPNKNTNTITWDGKSYIGTTLPQVIPDLKVFTIHIGVTIKYDMNVANIWEWITTSDVDFSYSKYKSREWAVLKWKVDYENFEHKDDMQLVTEARYKERKELYKKRLEVLGINPNETSPLEYLNEHLVAGDFLGQNIPSINIRYLYFLRKLEEQLGRGKKWSDNTTAFTGYCAASRQIDDYARMSSVGSSISDHATGFAFDFDKTHNPYLQSAENLYQDQYIQIVTGKKMCNKTYDVFGGDGAVQIYQASVNFLNWLDDNSVTFDNLRGFFVTVDEYEDKINAMNSDRSSVYTGYKNQITALINACMLSSGAAATDEEFDSKRTDLINGIEAPAAGFESLLETLNDFETLFDACKYALFINYDMNTNYLQLYAFLAEYRTNITTIMNNIQQIRNSGNVSKENWNNSLSTWYSTINSVTFTADYQTYLTQFVNKFNEKSNIKSGTFTSFADHLRTETQGRGDYLGGELFNNGFCNLNGNMVKKIIQTKVTINNEQMRLMWGGSYYSSKDIMHFELRKSAASKDRPWQKVLHGIAMEDIKVYLNSFKKQDGSDYSY